MQSEDSQLVSDGSDGEQCFGAKLGSVILSELSRLAVLGGLPWDSINVYKQ